MGNIIKKGRRNQYYNLGGTIRCRSANETLACIIPYFSKIGISRVANITGLDSLGIFVTTCIRPFAKHLSVSQGKGLTLELAKVSAIMEAVEAYHMENPPLKSFRGIYQKLTAKGQTLISPNQFTRALFSKIDLELIELDWCKANDLLNNQEVYIPWILSCLDTTCFHPEYSFLNVSTNGIGAGNNFEEAMCHALYELIERDSLMRFRLLPDNEKESFQLSLQNIDSEINQTLIDKYLTANVKVKVWDITSPLKIPSFHCVIQGDDDTKHLGVFTGTGTHLSKEIALSRALTESAQARLTFISGSRDDVLPNYYLSRNRIGFSAQQRIFKEGTRLFNECISVDVYASFEANIQYMINQLEREDFNKILYVDHTKPELNIPVVQVFIPGLKFSGARM